MMITNHEGKVTALTNSLSIFQKHLTFLNYSLKNYPIGSNFNRELKLDKYYKKMLLKNKT